MLIFIIIKKLKQLYSPLNKNIISFIIIKSSIKQRFKKQKLFLYKRLIIDNITYYIL